MQLWYKFSPLSGTRVKPKPHKRRRRMYESLQTPSQKPKVFHRYNLLEFGKLCEELSWNHRTTTPSSIRSKWNCRTSCTSNQRSDTSCIIAIWIGWEVVVGFYGMLLQSAWCPRPPGRQEISIWKKIWGILLGHAFFEGQFGKKMFWLMRLKNWKGWMHQKYVPKDWMRKKSW